MNPPVQFCPNESCPDRGRRDAGNLRVHSQQEKRYRCLTCTKTFTETKGTPLYRLPYPPELVRTVIALLAHGCPLQAVVIAFCLDERTVANWQARAGEHGHRIPEHFMAQGTVALPHVQADERWVKLVKRRIWMAMAIALPSRLWLGGVLGEARDLPLLLRLAGFVRRWANRAAMLVCVDGLAGYVTAFRRVFRSAVHTGKRGRPRLVAEPGLLLGQVIKRYAGRRVVSTLQRVVQGTEAQILAVMKRTGSGPQIHTAYIERLNATFRGALVALTRRGRRLAQKETVLEAGMYLVGGVYNFCTYHESLRLLAGPGSWKRWVERTPAMAAGLTGDRWGTRQLMEYRVPPPPWTPPRGGSRGATPPPGRVVK